MNESTEDPDVPAQEPEELAPTRPDVAADDRAYHRRREDAARADATKRAAKWVLVVAIMQIAIGTFLGLREQPKYDQALKDIEWMSEKYKPLEGEDITVGELRVMLERERVQVLAIPIGIGVMFIGMFFWARRSPLPALITALALFLVVHAVTGVLDPSEIPRGIIVKVFFIVVLVKGIRSALEARVLSMASEQRA